MPKTQTRASPAAPAPARATPAVSPGTTNMLLIGGAVLAGVYALRLIQSKGGLSGLFKPTTAKGVSTVAKPAVATQAAQVPVPSEAGVTFRSGSVGGFIPIPFDSIFSSVFSIFQPSKTQAAQATSARPVQAPQPEQYQTLPQTYVAESVPQYDADGIFWEPTWDEFVAGSGYYDEGPSVVSEQDFGWWTEEVPVEETYWVEGWDEEAAVILPGWET